MSGTIFSYAWLEKWLLPAGIFLTAFVIIALTISDYGLSWDEPGYFYASDLHIQWMTDFGKNLLKGQAGSSLQDDAIKAAWRWNPYHVPHPPLSRILSGFTKAIFSQVIDKFIAYRLAPALFFALLVTVMYLWMAEIFDRLTALFSALTLVLIPNLFGFAHLAVTDMPLAAMWFLTAYCFWKGLQDWRWSVVLGVSWGLALTTKFPALLIPIPLLLCGQLYYRRSYADNLFSMVFLSPLVMILSQPYLWHQTFLRILEFLYEGLSRGYRAETNFAIFLFGRSYFTSELPWYYPFFITAVTTPEPILALSLIGIGSMAYLKLQRPVMSLWLLNAVLILFMGLLPGAVLHDGVRQLLPALPFLAGLVGGGFFVLMRYAVEWAQKRTVLQKVKRLRIKLIGALSLLILLPPALDLLVHHPYELSYYNRLVGGTRGAYERGLEVTYFMEAFTPGFLRLLNKRLPMNTAINASFANFMFRYYQKERRLRQDIKIVESGNFDYYILLNRRSAISKRDQLAIQNSSHYVSLAVAGVPLISVYQAKKE